MHSGVEGGVVAALIGRVSGELALSFGVLPEGFGLPPLPYLFAQVALLALVVAGLWRLRPSIDDRAVLALTPWIVAGGFLHALYQIGTFPDIVAPLFGTAAVYATTAGVAGFVWVGAEIASEDPSVGLGTVGVVAALVTLGYGWVVTDGGTVAVWAGVALVAASAVTALVWVVLRRVAPESAEVAAWTGLVVVFGHALDGASTAVGYDVIGVYERTPLSRLLLEFAADLPTAEYVGAGWLFVLIKLLLAGGIVVLFREYIRDSPGEARLLLLFVAAVGLGPGAHNLLLFAFG